MQPTTSSPKPCKHCGAILQPRTLELGGISVFGGWERCSCPGATAERQAWQAERDRQERAAAIAAQERRLDEAGIPPKYREATHPWAERMADRVLSGDGFYLHGPNGTLKTTLACSVGIICLNSGMNVRFAVATKLLDELRDFGETSRELLKRMTKCDLLIIDDLGKEGAATPRAAEKLFDLFNDRANESTLVKPKPIIVTSNFPRSNVALAISEGGAGVAIASRLAEMTITVPMDGDDRRLTNGSH